LRSRRGSVQQLTQGRFRRFEHARDLRPLGVEQRAVVMIQDLDVLKHPQCLGFKV
jgi:hypothetical protein